MGREFTENKERYCLWLKGISEAELESLPFVKQRVENCRKYRETSKPTGDAYKYKDIPHLFRPASKFDENQPYFAMPQTSTQNRIYIPMGFVSNGMIPGQKLYIIPNASLYLFGVMNSIVHMAWTRVVCGRMKSDYSYSVFIVYNNFPWPTSNANKNIIEQTARDILAARENHPDKSLSDLYDPDTMPTDLKAAHEANDRAVMDAYGFSTDMTESEIVAELMKMYQKLTEEKYYGKTCKC